MVKNPLANAGYIRDVVGSLGWENPLEEGMATNPLPYSCLKNPMDRGTWQAMAHRVMKS